MYVYVVSIVILLVGDHPVDLPQQLLDLFIDVLDVLADHSGVCPGRS